MNTRPRRIGESASVMLDTVILPFWSALRDDRYGGFTSYVGYDLKPNPEAEKGCILNSRILWFFSEAALVTKREEVARYADHAYAFLMDHCLDKTNGGVFWSVHADGTPFDTTKHTYNQAFAIYALSAYYRLSGNQQALRTARELFQVIETHCTDADGYLEAFTVDWKPVSNEKLSENGVMATRTMNTLLHVFEGYAGLYQACSDPAVERALRRILELYATRIYAPELHRQLVFFDAEYRSLIDLYSYGHDIESSWLIDWGTELLSDSHLQQKIGEINLDLADSVYRCAYREHSLLNECERGKDDTTRIWWVQAEAVMGFVHAYEKTGATRYAEAASDIWQYIEQKMVDCRPGGEWFWSVDEKGSPLIKPIVEPWKCPYHNGRLCLELMRKDPDIYV